MNLLIVLLIRKTCYPKMSNDAIIYSDISVAVYFMHLLYGQRK
ncbi:hypothetical protein DDI_4298 [Dickeya dianthicola RNS04.9]|nr:hypothetical protein DDI_4298 [Dickeya dianthicola RNS04.9]